MKKNTVSGGCYRGNIRYEIHTDLDPDHLPRRKCGCDFCVMHGAVYTSDPNGELHIWIQDRNNLSLFQFGTNTAHVHICKVCGVEPFFVSNIDGQDHAVVNLNTATDPKISTEEYKKTDFSAETVDSRLERRSNTWIPTVVFE